MRGCVAYNDLWPWPISSRSFGLGLENRVRSVASTVPDGVFPYLVQMITSMRRCVTCDDLWPWPLSSRSFDLVLTWGIQHDSIVWVIMRRRGVSSERRRSSCSNLQMQLFKKSDSITVVVSVGRLMTVIQCGPCMISFNDVTMQSAWRLVSPGYFRMTSPVETLSAMLVIIWGESTRQLLLPFK